MALEMLADASFTPGSVFAGHYRIVRCLGRGSMGIVFACRDMNLSNRLVAVKVLYPEVMRDPVASERFYREIVLTYSIDNPHVVSAYDCFKEGDLFGFAMEYVDGGDLGRVLDEEKTLPVSEVLRLLKEICSALEAIHSIGIIHRDVKPENVLLSKTRSVKLTDLGVARNVTASRLTEHATLLGSIDYVSPEYLAYGGIDRRSDLYALGVIAYRMITGRTPSSGKHLVEILANRVRSDPAAPSTLRAECPVGLDAVVLKALARDPAQRYQTAAEVQEDLELIEPEHAQGGGRKIAHAVWDSWRLVKPRSERKGERERPRQGEKSNAAQVVPIGGGDMPMLRRRLLQTGAQELLTKRKIKPRQSRGLKALNLFAATVITALCCWGLAFNQPQSWLLENRSSKPAQIVLLAQKELVKVRQDSRPIFFYPPLRTPELAKPKPASQKAPKASKPALRR